jgi:hypothetical protein
MALDYKFRSIDHWPRAFTKGRRGSPFKSSLNQTIRLLGKEISSLNGKDVVFQIAIPSTRIRKDGMPYADTQPEHPGIILSFTGKAGPIQMPCDAFTHWHGNLRAIALALEALRRVDRYGVTSKGEQYRGWNQLPGPIVTPEAMSVEAAAMFIKVKAGFCSATAIMEHAADFKSAYRAAALKLHPDTGIGGVAWHALQAAADVLRKHHRVEL